LTKISIFVTEISRERHIQGFESRMSAAPFMFKTSAEFCQFFKSYELESAWLNCFADYLERESKSSTFFIDAVPKWLQLRRKETFVDDKNFGNFTYNVESLRHRIIPSNATMRIVDRKVENSFYSRRNHFNFCLKFRLLANFLSNFKKI